MQLNKEQEEALNWFMTQRIISGDERSTVMKALDGDPSNRLRFSGEGIAYFLAKYLDEKTK